MEGPFTSRATCPSPTIAANSSGRPPKHSAVSTSSSTMPASNTSRPSRNYPPERWDAIIAINLSSAFHTSAAALPAMQEARWGRIVNIASAHGLRGSINKSAYVAAKHGVVGLTKVTALENAEAGITCNAVCPGFVLTPLVEKQIEDLMAEKDPRPATTVGPRT